MVLSRTLRQFLVIFSLILLSPSVWAWGSIGHRVAAQIAYDNLSKHARDEANRLNHALDGIWQTYSFTTSANWPDWLFGHDVTAFANWHYIDRGYAADETVPQSFDSHNVVWAINQAIHVLNSRRSTDGEKAIFLRFLIHFVGDIHQPLHCIDRYSVDFPQGDDGGNLFLIDGGKIANLHRLWDRGVGYFEQFSAKYPRHNEQIKVIASAIEQRFPRSYFQQQLAINDPNVWSQEGYQLAKLYAYDLELGSKPSLAYVKQAQEVVAKQLALSGYRMAALLNRLL